MAAYSYTPLSHDETRVRGRAKLWHGFLLFYCVVSTLIIIGLAVVPQMLATKTDLPPRLRTSLIDDIDVRVRYRIEDSPPENWSDLYTGPPSPASENAWHELIYGERGSSSSFELSREEARAEGINFAMVTPEGNPVAISGVHHNLHCLRRLRQIMYSEEYYPNATQEVLDENRHHALHCIEAIRSSVVCRPDFSSHVFVWADEIKSHPLAVSPRVRRQCVDWDSIEEVMDSRAYNSTETIRQHRNQEI